MEIKTFLILILALLAVVGVVLFYHEYMTMRAKVKNIDERMKKLEHANRKRMPYAAFDSLLDARAALNRFREENRFYDSLIENAEAHLDKAMTEGTKRADP